MGNVATLDDRVILRDCIFPGLCMGAGSIDLLQSTRSLHTLLEVFEGDQMLEDKDADESDTDEDEDDDDEDQESSGDDVSLGNSELRKGGKDGKDTLARESPENDMQDLSVDVDMQSVSEDSAGKGAQDGKKQDAGGGPHDAAVPKIVDSGVYRVLQNKNGTETDNTIHLSQARILNSPHLLTW